MGSTTNLNLDFDDVLEHYGVKGMKWGVRRTPEQLGRARAARKARKADAKKQKEADRKRPASEDATRAAQARRVAKNAGTSKLSNQELEFLVNRMNLESRYIKVLGDDQKSAGKIFLDKILNAENKAFMEGKKSPTVTSIENSQEFVGKALEKAMGIVDIGPTLDKALRP